MSGHYTPPPPGPDTGPLPARSAVGLALQLWLQWLYLLPWIAIYEVGDFGYVDESWAEGNITRHVLTPSRYRLERHGAQQDWEMWADKALDRGTKGALYRERGRRAENARGKNRYKHKETEPTTFIKKRYYRGIGAAGVAALAARRGWEVDWKRTDPGKAVHLVYRKPLGS
ncbi:hypothetical protein [Saccharothrix sp. ST-888]|uniref:hypothetical protein n=1 Tax=Saccharothrix sp. ST-888 TaxID=1427391 RepID=UPI0005ECFB87|nr:hypothetical protein [Saccharothrix sp. ST-888]KJK58397.1 hypothetical protein UK12_10805 [Saccharothrix sp. ST-888]